MLAGGGPAGIDHTGDPGALTKLMGLLDAPDPAFAIVTPVGRAWSEGSEGGPRPRGPRLSVPQPALEVLAVDDAHDQYDPILEDHVVQHAEITDPEPVERVSRAPYRLDALPGDAGGTGRVGCELNEGGPNPPSIVVRQTLERARRVT